MCTSKPKPLLNDQLKESCAVMKTSYFFRLVDKSDELELINNEQNIHIYIYIYMYVHIYIQTYYIGLFLSC